MRSVLFYPINFPSVILMSKGVLATFAAGCFWGTEHFFVKKFKDALLAHEVGYMGGKDSSTVSYESVKKGDTGHAEVLHITYDESKITYDDLLAYFFSMHNSTTINRQEGDVGTQYRSAVFYHNDEQKRKAIEYIDQLNGADPVLHGKYVKAFGGAKCVTLVEPASHFFKAEDYHQNYLNENPNGYCAHRLYF